MLHDTVELCNVLTIRMTLRWLYLNVNKIILQASALIDFSVLYSEEFEKRPEFKHILPQGPYHCLHQDCQIYNQAKAGELLNKEPRKKRYRPYMVI